MIFVELRGRGVYSHFEPPQQIQCPKTPGAATMRRFSCVGFVLSLLLANLCTAIDAPVRLIDPNDRAAFSSDHVDVAQARQIPTDHAVQWRSFPIGRGLTLDL
ncbi:MAG: hypothetical protein AB7N73_15675, partial [Gemmatimonadales bacterium]